MARFVALYLSGLANLHLRILSVGDSFLIKVLKHVVEASGTVIINPFCMIA